MRKLEELMKPETLNDFLRSQTDLYNLNALDFPVESGAFAWESLNPETRDKIMAGIIRNTLEIAVNHVSAYRDDERWQYAAVLIKHLEKPSDLTNFPLMSKNDIPGTGSRNKPGIRGYRGELIEDPFFLVPENIDELILRQERANPDHKQILEKYQRLENYNGTGLLFFGSGGTEGESTEIALSYLSIQLEAMALAKGLYQNGMRENQNFASMYPLDHKGGLQLKLAAEILNMPFHSKDMMFQWIWDLGSSYRDAIENHQQAVTYKDFETANQHTGPIREGLRKYFVEHNINVIAAVQPTKEGIVSGSKGQGLTFMEIYNEDKKAFESVEHMFLTGYTVPEHAWRTLQEDGKIVSTEWGATEAMALGASGFVSQGDINDLKAHHFPTAGLVVRRRERGLKREVLDQIEEGRGLLLIQSYLPAKSITINNLMDVATATLDGFYLIERMPGAKVSIGDHSCAGEALRVPTLNQNGYQPHY